MTSNNRRAGFIIVELLVVIAILLVLAGLALAVFNAGKSSDKMRSAARTTQSAFLGAKDRALHAKDLRGLRLTHDSTNFNLVNGFVYVQSLGTLKYPTGSLSLERQDFITNGTGNPPPDGFADTADILILHGYDGTEGAYVPGILPVDWNSKSQFFASPMIVKIPAGTGSWFPFSMQGNNRYSLAQGNEYLQLGTAYPPPFGAVASPAIIALSQNSTYSSCEIMLANDMLPFHQPITLPSGCVIDLFNSQIPAQWYQQQSTLPNSVPAGAVVCGPDPATPGNVVSRNYVTNMEVMFSPRGNVTGAIGVGSMFFLLRDIRDATNQLNPSLLANQPKLQGDMLILSVFPQTGLVQTFEVDLTDNVNNTTGAAGSDGLADNLAGFAQRGQTAGR